MQGYWLILGSEVVDEAAQAAYVDLWKPIAIRYGAKISVLKKDMALHETQGYSRVVVVEFESYNQALACYHDPEYQIAKVLALKASRRELLILQGQPPRS